jgi:hypothetical protein
MEPLPQGFVKKPGFVYMRSAVLDNMIIALSEKSGTLYCEDGVQYSREEMEIIGENDGKIDRAVHLIKKVFKGSKVVRNDKGNSVGNASEGECGESSPAKNDAVTPSAGSQIQETQPVGQGNESPELDIY